MHTTPFAMTESANNFISPKYSFLKCQSGKPYIQVNVSQLTIGLPIENISKNDEKNKRNMHPP